MCDSPLADTELYRLYRICATCRFHYTLTARERINLLADTGTFRENHRSIVSLDPLSFSSRVSYRQRLFRDQRRTGLTEAVVTGTCSIGGTRVVLVVLDFGFLGGTMGSVVGEKVTLGLELGAKKKLPVVCVVTSGGTRIQEGVLSLMQMAKTATAVNRFSQKSSPFICVLANPTTGQAYSSFSNLADIILAEPGALIGTAPLRDLEEASHRALPLDSRTAESYLEHGMIDGITDRETLKDLLTVLLDLLKARYTLTPTETGPKPTGELLDPGAWERVKLARHSGRPTSLDYILRLCPTFIELHGDRLYGDDKAVVCGLGYLGGQGVVVIGQEKGHGVEAGERHEGRVSPEGFRKAQRAMGLAAKFKLPVISLIDTPGALADQESENRGLGNAIATSMAFMADLPVPTIAVIIGEGGSEGALALGVADRVLMLENAIYMPISPENAAAILYRDTGKAQEMAESLRLTAADCRELEIIDGVIPEPPGGAHVNLDEAARQLMRTLLRELADLQRVPLKRLLRDRYKKFRNMGEYSSRLRVAITREVNQLQQYVVSGVKRIRSRRRPKEAQLPEPPVTEPDIPSSD